MRLRPLLAFLLLLALLLGSEALTAKEETAVREFMGAFPVLASASPPWLNASDACNNPPFYGLSCSNDTDPHILGLSVNLDGSHGTMPDSIVFLAWLETLSVRNACISKALPFNFGYLTNLKSLQLLDAENATCDRDPTFIPASLSRATGLKHLTIVMSSLSGEVPQLLGSLHSLERVRLGGAPNKVAPISGTIPWIDSPHLKALLLEYTLLDGFDSRGDGSPNWPALEDFSILGSANLSNLGFRTFFGSPKLKRFDCQGATRFKLFEFHTAPCLPNLTHIYSDAGCGITLSYKFWNSVPNLEHFSAVNNRNIRGTLDESVGLLSRLSYLDLTNASLSAYDIPNNITRCPIEVLRLARTEFTSGLPRDIGNLKTTIVELDLSQPFAKSVRHSSKLPDSLGYLYKLQRFSMSSANLTGTIPSSVRLLSALKVLDLSNNALNGSIPDIRGDFLTSSVEVNLHSNFLGGSIPPIIAARALRLHLSNNYFQGVINETLFSTNEDLLELVLSHNRFSGPLPRLSNLSSPLMLDMSSNQFNDTVWLEYYRAKTVKLMNNQLSGSLFPLLASDSTTLESLHLDENNFTTELPDLSNLINLHTLSISSNNFTGALPALPLSIRRFVASNNNFYVSHWDTWSRSNATQALELLDLSGDSALDLDITDFTTVVGPNMFYLALPAVSFNLIARDREPMTALNYLHVERSSGNALQGRLFPNLASLSVSDSSVLDLEIAPLLSLSQLDISQGGFKFEASRFSLLPVLTTINARTNKIYGALNLDNLINLQSADFSDNDLDHPPDFDAINRLVQHRQLRLLNISDNPRIPSISPASGLLSSLTRTKSSKPSSYDADRLICYGLTFSDYRDLTFEFDESLFSYMQCDCNDKHFGVPPDRCLACPSRGSSNCGKDSVTIESDYYVFQAPKSTKSSKQTKLDASNETSLLQLVASTASNLLSNLRQADAATTSAFTEVDTESCLVTTVQTLSGNSNCKGITITAKDLQDSSMSVLLEKQCAEGSRGRLCSACICDRGSDACYFQDGAVCSKCKDTVSRPVAVLLAFLGILLIIALGSPLMMLIIRVKRKETFVPFHSLSVFQRILQRILHLFTIGQITIMVNFLQIVLSITQWDTYAQVSFLGLINGPTESFGLNCFFPMLSNPMVSLLVGLSAPFVGVALVAVVTYIGHRWANWLERRAAASTDSDDDDEASSLLDAPQTKSTNYPSMALFTSTSISVVKFFFFGTAMIAHGYLFSTRQASTGILYSQKNPWMRFSDTYALIGVSVPAIILFDLGVPLLFLVVCYRLRSDAKRSYLAVYCGSLWESFSPNCYWWEIVMTLRKLSIALVLQGIPATNATQMALITSILSATMLVQQQLNPWIHRVENIADGISSLLLIAALVFTRPGQFTSTQGVVGYTIALSSAFILFNVVCIIRETVFGKTGYESRLERLMPTAYSVDQTGYDLEPSELEASDLEALGDVD